MLVCLLQSETRYKAVDNLPLLFVKMLPDVAKVDPGLIEKSFIDSPLIYQRAILLYMVEVVRASDLQKEREVASQFCYLFDIRLERNTRSPRRLAYERSCLLGRERPQIDIGEYIEEWRIGYLICMAEHLQIPR